MEDDGNVGTVIISTAAHVVCSNETVSSFAITAMGVNVTDRPDVVWLIQYTSPNDVKEPAVDIYNFSSEALYHTHVWSCPSQLGDWNVSVQICFVPSNPSIVPCLDPSDRLAANTTIVSVQGEEIWCRLVSAFSPALPSRSTMGIITLCRPAVPHYTSNWGYSTKAIFYRQ